MSKIRRLLFFGLLITVTFIGVATVIFVRANTFQKVAGLDSPYVVFNFNPQKLENFSDVDQSQSMYLYDLSSGTVQAVLPHNGIYYSDWDADTGMLIGLDGGQVVEISFTEGVKRTLGKGMRNGEPLVASTIRWRPNSRDYSALTESGVLVLYRQETGSFEVLADMSAMWNGYCFGGSWVDDGKTLCVPDEMGIALLDVASKKLEHWITLPITYSPDSTNDFHDNRTAFVVSNDKTLIVYCEGDALKTVTIGASGEMGEAIILDEYADYDRSFAIAPNGEAILFVAERMKHVLFTPHYIEIDIRYNGVITKLVETPLLARRGICVLW